MYEDAKMNKGNENMVVVERVERIRRKSSNSPSSSFLKLRHKMQTQMRKNSISYEEILKMTVEAKRNK